MDRSKIIERVKNLLAMASDVSSPNEAAIAAKRARSLMDQYQLSIGELTDKSDFAIGGTGPSRRYTPKWEQSIAVVIAQYNDCIGTFIPDETGLKIGFKGFEVDVRLCEFMFVYITENCKASCSVNTSWMGTRYNARVGTMFKEAYSLAICDRLNELIAERKSHHISDNRSLVVIKAELVAKEFGEAKYSSYKVKTPKDDKESHAHKMGIMAGQSVPLHVGIE